jgi:hypothetical protein
MNPFAHPDARRQPLSLLIALCWAAGLYGILFGMWMLPTGLFVGPHGLVAAAGHISLGALFIAAARALRIRTSWAPLLAASCSFLCIHVGFIAAYQSIGAQQADNLIFFAPFTLFFSCLAVLSIWQCSHTQFSLRHLLIAITLLGMAFGTIAYFISPV